MKIKWKVQPAPTGRYRSFEKRGWPSAKLPDGTLIGYISCKDVYFPADSKSGKHAPLTVHVYNFNPSDEQRKKHGGRVHLTLKAHAATLQEAKDRLIAFYAAHPEMLPIEKPEVQS